MKKDKAYWSLEISKLVLFLIVPIAIFIYKFTTIGQKEGGVKFIVGCSAYIFAILVYIAFKKIFLKKYIKEISEKKVNYLTELETETDEEKMTLTEKALRKCLIVESIFTIIPIILAFGLLLLVIKALENDLITFCSALGICLISYIVGFIICIVQNATTKSKNRK